MSLSEYPVIELDTIDSTNNYAMQLIDADKAQHGLTIVARTQQAGKGQRGRTWQDEPGDSLLMSLIVVPNLAIGNQFAFNANIAAAITEAFRESHTNLHIQIKWPNDIIINDKKAAGILIENVLRGSTWAHSVIGLGVNVGQSAFPPDLPNATSLKIELKNDVDMTGLRDKIRDKVMAAVNLGAWTEGLAQYNRYLYKKGERQQFTDGINQWQATILAVGADGTLEVILEDGSHAFYHHGQVLWDWRA